VQRRLVTLPLTSIQNFANFQRLLAPPRPSLTMPGGAQSIAKGRAQFENTGCAFCRLFSYVVSGFENRRRFNAEIAEHAEKSSDSCSAVFAVSAFNVICSHALKTGTTYVYEINAPGSA
jgi:hypothetical protein